MLDYGELINVRGVIMSRWDITSIDKLPPTISTSFLALYNTTNEIGYEILNEKGFNVIPYLRKMVMFLPYSYLIWDYSSVSYDIKEVSYAILSFVWVVLTFLGVI